MDIVGTIQQNFIEFQTTSFIINKRAFYNRNILYYKQKCKNCYPYSYLYIGHINLNGLTVSGYASVELQTDVELLLTVRKEI